MAADLIDDFLTRLAQHVPQAQQALPKLEAELRHHWGGTERTYIRKRPAPAQRAQALGQALSQGLPLAEAFRVAGTPRRTGYRLLGKVLK